MASEVTVMPRAKSRSSTSWSLTLQWKYCQTPWLRIAAGKREGVYRSGVLGGSMPFYLLSRPTRLTLRIYPWGDDAIPGKGWVAGLNTLTMPHINPHRLFM
jgi:hypothetical protein